MNIKETVKNIKEGKILSIDITKKYLDTIKKLDKHINAYVTITEEYALDQAQAVDSTVAEGKADELSDIAGIPQVLKDNISVRGIRMTASSKMLDDYISPYDATVTKRLKDSVLLGKGNLDAFAFGASTENSGYFVSKNPWNTEKVAGGSSGGVAAAVAAKMAQFGIGTDTGGSIRQPAAFCGVVGLKPTYGRSSRYGLAAMGSSLDCPGPITNCVEDAAYILNLIAGYDEKDSTSMNTPVPDFTQFRDIKGMKAGLPKEFFGGDLAKGLDSGLKDQVMATVKKLERLGVEIVDVSMPYSTYALPVYYIITPSEITANMARYDGIRYGHTTDDPKDLLDLYFTSRDVLEDEVKRRIFVGNYSLSSGYYDAYYNKAMKVRTLIIQEMQEVFKQVDFIVGPTTPTPAFNIGENTSDPIAMYLADIFTVTANIAGIPAISIPCGLAHELPVGFQIMGKQFDEKTILDVAYALQEDLQFSKNFTPNLEKIQ